MDHDPPNLYIDMPLRELSTVIGNRAGDLLADRPAGRRDTAYLLIAAARKLDPMTPHPGSPVNQVKGGDTALAAFLPVYEDEARRMRYRIFVHASDTLCMHHGVERLLPHGHWDHLAALATKDDDGLREAIMQLDTAAQSRGT